VLTFKELLQEYADNSRSVSIEYVDPYLYPQFVERYSDDENTPEGTVIVVSGSRYRTISPFDMITMDYNYDMQSFQVRSIDIEPLVTNAINYAIAENTSSIYTFASYNELGIPETLTNQMMAANYEVMLLDIVTDEIPDDCAILFLTQPGRDWTADTADKVRDYLQNGGRALFAIDSISTETTNINSVLGTFGISIGEYLVIEGSSSNYIRNPTYILPDIVQHEITQSLIERRFRPFLLHCSGIDILEDRSGSISIESLLSTTSGAFGRLNANPQALNLIKSENDVDGPIDLALAVTDSYNDAMSTKLIVVSASHIIDEQANDGSNYLFLINSLNWLQDKEDAVFIPSKEPRTFTPLDMTQREVNALMFVSAVVIPLSIFILGLIVWRRRRYS
jgi:hypothetical protein